MLGFNDKSTLVGHFVSSPREREKRDKEIAEEMKERDREESKSESEEIEEIKTYMYSLYPYLLQGSQAVPKCKPISVGHPSNVRYKAPSPHPTTLGCVKNQNRLPYLS